MSPRWLLCSILLVFVFTLGACFGSTQPTAQVIVVTTTPLPPVPTAVVQIVVVTATPVPPTETPIPATRLPTAIPLPPTAIPIIVTATNLPAPAVKVPSPTSAPAGFIYPPPSLSGTCGSTLTPGDFIMDIGFPQGLKDDEFFDIRARPSWELQQPGWRGVAVTKETHYVIRGMGTRYQYSFINNPWERGTYFMSVAVIRQLDGKWMGQLSPESNTCALQW